MAPPSSALLCSRVTLFKVRLPSQLSIEPPQLESALLCSKWESVIVRLPPFSIAPPSSLTLLYVKFEPVILITDPG